MRTFTILVDDFPAKVGHPPRKDADLSKFAKGDTVTDADIHHVFGWANRAGKGGQVDIARLESSGWIEELVPAHEVNPLPSPTPAPSPSPAPTEPAGDEHA